MTKDAKIIINSGTDAVHVENSKDTTLGYGYFKDINFNLTTAQDGISTSAKLEIDGGNYTIFTSNSDSEESFKGIKSDQNVILKNSVMNITSTDDAIHSNGDIVIISSDD